MALLQALLLSSLVTDCSRILQFLQPLRLRCAYQCFAEDTDLIESILGHVSLLLGSEHHEGLSPHLLGLAHPHLNDLAVDREQVVQVNPHLWHKVSSLGTYLRV